MTVDREFLSEVLVEGREMLSRLDRDLVGLEQRPDDRAVLGEIFRCVHTIKGCAGFAGLVRLECVAHATEGLLGKLRDGELRCTGTMASALLAAVDAMRAIFDRLDSAGDEGDASHAALIERLVRMAAGRQVSIALPRIVADLRGGTRRIALRVEVASFEHLAGVVDELNTVHGELLRSRAVAADPTAAAAARRITGLIAQLTTGIARSRREPIGTGWRKFPRLARDLALACNKKVRLEMVGADTEIDRSIADAVRDPLIHAVRNAIDHGIESPEARIAAGKPEVGRVVLRATHIGDAVTIQITDDGRGLDHARIRARAVELRLVSAERAAGLTERDAAGLVFHPGFSTAEEVTTVSGRGIGMDVVKANVERLGGRVELASRVGEGTTVTLHVPMPGGT